MNSKQLEKRRKLYAAMIKITALQPWDTVSEDVSFVYAAGDGEEKVVFNVIGGGGESFGVICYPSFYDYVLFQMRVRSKNTKGQPLMFMDRKLLCTWGDREDVDKENKTLIKELGYKFRGKDGWLFFSAVDQRRMPRFLTDSEAEFLCEALENLYSMLKDICEGNLRADFENNCAVIRKRDERGEWVNTAGLLCLTEPPMTVFEEDEDIKRLARMPKGELVIELDERCMPLPCREDGTNTGYFPLIITVMDSKSGAVLASRVLSYNIDREDVLFDIIFDLSEEFGKIKQIKINDEFTRAALADFCKKTDIKLNYQQKPLKNIDRFMSEIYEGFSQSLFEEMLTEDSGGNGNVSNARKASNGNASNGNASNGNASNGNASIARKSKTAKKKNSVTYVISVSLGTGCYRHIKISGDCTLEELHGTILDAFGFEDDHAHAFFLDNRAWQGDGYYSRYIEDGERYTCDFTLSRVLEEKQKFLYIFDFGDEWRFSCRVLRITDEACGSSEIIRTAGEAPEQYPDYDEY